MGRSREEARLGLTDRPPAPPVLGMQGGLVMYYITLISSDTSAFPSGPSQSSMRSCSVKNVIVTHGLRLGPLRYRL